MGTLTSRRLFLCLRFIIPQGECNRQISKRPPSQRTDVEMAVGIFIMVLGFTFLGSIHRKERFCPSLIHPAQIRRALQDPNQVAVGGFTILGVWPDPASQRKIALMVSM